jgi:hypothetical protein
MLRATYGAMYAINFNKDNPEHVKRAASVYLDIDGKLTIPGIFQAVLKKVNSQFRRDYF